jgi:endonuclease/exonuclease/phosphatase (EEP) superfamily protein YafD
MMQRLWELERAGWEALSGGDPRDFYDRLMTADAVMILPGMVLDREAVLSSWDGVPGWREFQLAEESCTEWRPGVVALTYHATARRADQPAPYRATMTSVYLRDGEDWRLALHQQTPDPPAGAAGG